MNLKWPEKLIEPVNTSSCSQCGKDFYSYNKGFNKTLSLCEEALRSINPKDLIDIKEECAGVTGVKIILKWKDNL